MSFVRSFASKAKTEKGHTMDHAANLRAFARKFATGTQEERGLVGAANEITLLQSIAYKLQCPENQNKFPNEFLSDDEKHAMRRAVVGNL